MTASDLPIEFNIEVPNMSEDLQNEVETELLSISEGHSDMTGASMTVSQLAHAESPHAFRASITVYMRPNNMHAEEKGENLEGVVKEALDSLERRIRERRNKLGEPWKRPDMDSSSAQ